MPAVRPSRLLSTANAQLQIITSSASRRALSTTQARNAGHDSHLEPPGGWLWGIKPGEKAPKEGWENIWYYGFFGSILFGVVGYAYKPDTSIQTWALEEARRRLEAEGILEDPEKKR